MTGSAQKRSSFGRRIRGFTLLEIQVALVIMGVGLLSFGALLAIQGRQLRSLEEWCPPRPPHAVYYVVSQSNRWMRQLGAPGTPEETAGGSPWTPPVSGQQKKYLVTLTSYTRDLDSREASVGTTLVLIE